MFPDGLLFLLLLRQKRKFKSINNVFNKAAQSLILSSTTVPPKD
jgi:hypothetical protein